jgi:hypothetical protein
MLRHGQIGLQLHASRYVPEIRQGVSGASEPMV